MKIIEVKDTSGQKKFVELPFQLYKGNEYWVPPIKSQEYNIFQEKTNPSLKFCEAAFWIATDDHNRTIGRIGAIKHNPYNEKTGIPYVRITRFECIDDEKVAKALFETVFEWALKRNLTVVHGPLGFTNLDLQGLLIEGVNYLPPIASVYHHAYYKNFFENQGFEKENDWVEFRLTLGEAAVNKANRGAELLKKRFGVELREFSSIKEVLHYKDQIFEILNDSFDVLPYVTPLTKELMEFYAKKYIALLNPEYIKMTFVDGEPIGFLISMPSVSRAMQKAKGRLLPFGIFHILKAKKGKGVDTLDQILTGVKKDKQNTGAAVIMQAAMQDTMLKNGLKYIETTGIFETNTNAISNWKNYDHIQHRRRRCYVKKIS